MPVTVMRITDAIRRVAFILPLALITLYFRGRHGEWIENARVQWAYVQDIRGSTCLAVNVTAPSGIILEAITSGGKDVTGSWRLLNYPDWYRGEEATPWLRAFTNELSPYLPCQPDPRRLYTTGRYTYLYEWRGDSAGMPAEASLKIRCRNLGTENLDSAEHARRPVLIPGVMTGTNGEPSVRLDLYVPAGGSARDQRMPSDYSLCVENLVRQPDSSGFTLRDPTQGIYHAALIDKQNIIQEHIRGKILQTAAGVGHVYEADATLGGDAGGTFEIVGLFRNILALVFMFYFMAAAWVVGRLFVRGCRLTLDSRLERLILPTFLGVVLLTYGVFAIGILGLLYRSLLLAVLAALLLVGFSPRAVIADAKQAVLDAAGAIREKPWVLAPAAVILGMLAYNLCYCFVPATYSDGAGDIVNSYLPMLSDYVRSHSFAAPIQNATHGISSQAMDVLRAVAVLFVGEPGVYLMSFVYLLILMSVLYLLARKVFHAGGGLLLVALALLLGNDLFIAHLHMGKHYAGTLASLMMFLYCTRYSDDDRNFFLPGLFLAFLVAQYLHFAGLAFAYYAALFVSLAWTGQGHRRRLARQYVFSAVTFSALAFLFNMKLIVEVGTCFPPGMVPSGLSDVFKTLNQDNPAYRYIDNPFIRFFCIHNQINIGQFTSSSWDGIDMAVMAVRVKVWMATLARMLDFWPVLFLLLFLKGWNKTKILFLLLTAALFLIIPLLLPRGGRQAVYFMYPLAVLQFAALHDGLSRLGQLIPQRRSWLPRAVTGTLAVAVVLCFALTVSSEGIGLRQSFALSYMQNPLQPPPHPFSRVRRVCLGGVSGYEFLRTIQTDLSMVNSGQPFPDSDNFDYAMLVRQYTAETNTVLIVPVRFHSHVNRRMTARHALGSVIYQKDMSAIMADLKALGITHLSVMPILYEDYCPFYTPIFEDDTFHRYFQFLFSYKGRRLYKVIPDGSNRDYTPSPYKVRGLPFVPMATGAAPGGR